MMSSISRCAVDGRVQIGRSDDAVERCMDLDRQALFLAGFSAGELIDREILTALADSSDVAVAEPLAEAVRVVVDQQLVRVGYERRRVDAFERVTHVDAN